MPGLLYKHNNTYEGSILVLPSDKYSIRWRVADQVRVPPQGVLRYPRKNAEFFSVRAEMSPTVHGNAVYVRGRFEEFNDLVVSCMVSNRIKTLAKLIASFNHAGFNVEICPIT